MLTHLLKQFLFMLGSLMFCIGCAGQATGSTLSLSPNIALAPTLTRLAPTTAESTVPRFEAAACKFQIGFTEPVECGYLVVPEDRSQANSRTIRLHVAIVKSHSKNPAPDPLIYLHGGPGFGALGGLTGIVKSYSRILDTRDLIVFDQRGVGYSEPSLDCPEADKQFFENLAVNSTRDENRTRTVQAYAACRDRLKSEGANLDAYSSAASAADVNDLRVALGYDKVNLYGISYGTRLALTTMRDFPSGIRSVILDSTVPVQVNLNAALAVDMERSLNLLFERCAADAKCNAAFPKLRTVFYDLVARLDAQPVKLELTDSTGTLRPVLVDGNEFIDGIFQLLYNSFVIPYLPKMIYDVNQGDYVMFRSYGGLIIFRHASSAEGMVQSVMCSESTAFSSMQAVESATAQVEPRLGSRFKDSARTNFAICAAWGVKPAGPIEHQAVSSNIPTLVLAGEYDPITPPSWGKLAAATLSQSYYYESPNTGHGALGSGSSCALKISTDFLDEPTKSPALDCYAGTYSFFRVP